MRRYWTQLVHPRLLAGDDGEAMGHEIVDRLIEQSRIWCERHGYKPLGGPEITVSHEIVSGSEMTAIEVAIRYEARWDGQWGHIRAALDEDGLLPACDRLSLAAALSGPPVGTVHVGIDPAAKTVGDMAWFMWDGHRWNQLPAGHPAAAAPVPPF